MVLEGKGVSVSKFPGKPVIKSQSSMLPPDLAVFNIKEYVAVIQRRKLLIALTTVGSSLQ
jgi:hypothetical protein